MIKYILSLTFYHIGDFFSKIDGYTLTAELYQQFMAWSVKLDPKGKVWDVTDLCEWRWDGPYNCYQLGCCE